LTALAEAVRKVVGELGDAHVMALSLAYRNASACTADVLASAHNVVPAVHHTAVDRLHRAWQFDPELPGAAIALALESARLTMMRSESPEIEIVVTGPDSPAVPIRLTSEVVVGLITDASRRVTIVSYSVARIPAVIAALADAKARGVRVNLIFESPGHFAHGGGVRFYGAHPIYQWAVDRRAVPHALLHAKAVIIDGQDILVTSANLSNLAQQSSLELGLLCRGGGIADRVQRHFDALIANGVLQGGG